MHITGEEDRRLYEHVMTKGSIKSGFALVILLGVAGSGKTLFRHLVLGLPVPEFSPSTPLAETSVRSMFHSRIGIKGGGDGSVEWIIVNPKNMMKMVANEITGNIDVPESSNQGATPHVDINERKQMERTSNPPAQKGITQDSEVTKEKQVLQDDSQPLCEKAHTSEKVFSKTFHDALKGIKMDSDLMINSFKTLSQKLRDIDFIYLLDSGGQPPFREMLPHFVQQSSAIVLMQKLNERLDIKPTIKYREKEGKVDKGYTCHLTNEQILHQYVQAAQSQKSKVFVVGTHRDLEDKCENETREMKNDILLKAFRPVLRKQMELYKVGNPDQLIFPVDSTSREPDDMKIAQEFRKRIIDKCMGKKEEIPLPWFILEQLLQSLANNMDVKVLSMDECHEAAEQKLCMPHNLCEAGIRYLGKLNIVFYRPKILPGVVFCNAQVILDKITELVCCSCVLRTSSEPSTDEKLSSYLQSEEGLKMKESGHINPELLQKAFPLHYRENIFTSSHFLQLLEGLLIAGKLDNGEHFIPSLLPDLPMEKVADYRVESPEYPAPLVIYYPKQFVPVGVMPSLVVYLQNICEWKPSEIHDKPICLYHNCIQFKLPGGKPGNLVLIDSTKFLEIHVSPHRMDPKLLYKIRKSVMTGLEEAHKSLHYDTAKAEIGFLCSGECGNKETHYATLDNDVETWVCSEDEKTGNDLNRKQTPWFQTTDKGLCNT